MFFVSCAVVVAMCAWIYGVYHMVAGMFVLRGFLPSDRKFVFDVKMFHPRELFWPAVQSTPTRILTGFEIHQGKSRRGGTIFIVALGIAVLSAKATGNL